MANIFEPAGSLTDDLLLNPAASIDKANKLAIFYTRLATNLRAVFETVEQREQRHESHTNGPAPTNDTQVGDGEAVDIQRP